MFATPRSSLSNKRLIMKSKKLKAGIIGLGVGEKHIHAYNSHCSCEVISICDFNKQKLEEVSAKYPLLTLTNNADNILTDPEINIVSIASYDNFHFEHIKQAIKHGKHIYVEKPLCLFENEAKEIKKLLNAHPEIHLSSNLVLRTCPRFIRLKKAIQDGEMGNIYNIQADYLWGRIHKLLKGWRKDMNFYSIINGAAVHMVDLVLWLTGMLPLEVTGYSNRIATRDSAMKYNDFTAFLLKFESSMIAEIKAHGGCVHPHFHNLNIMGTKKTFMQNILGAKWINSMNPDDALQDIKEEYPEKTKRIVALTSFIDSIIDNNITPLVSKKDVFNTISVCFAAEKAIQKNKTVKINYI